MNNKVKVELELDTTEFNKQVDEATKRLEAYKKLRDEIQSPVSIGIDFARAEDISIVVVTSDSKFPQEAFKRIGETMQSAFCNAKIVVVDDGMRIKLIKAGDMGDESL